MMRVGLALGVNFWDLADGYGSHPHAKRALGSIPRESVVISTKTSATTDADATSAVERFLKELGTDYLESCTCTASRPTTGRRSGPARWRRSPDSRRRASSGPSASRSTASAALATLPTEPWVDVVLARINWAGVNMDDMPDKVVPILHQIHAAGKGLYAMKVLGQEGNYRRRAGRAHLRTRARLPRLAERRRRERGRLRECVRIVEEIDGE